VPTFWQSWQAAFVIMNRHCQKQTDNNLGGLHHKEMRPEMKQTYKFLLEVELTILADAEAPAPEVLQSGIEQTVLGWLETTDAEEFDQVVYVDAKVSDLPKGD
jgi:hypothetical protein